MSKTGYRRTHKLTQPVHTFTTLTDSSSSAFYLCDCDSGDLSIIIIIRLTIINNLSIWKGAFYSPMWGITVKDKLQLSGSLNFTLLALIYRHCDVYEEGTGRCIGCDLPIIIATIQRPCRIQVEKGNWSISPQVV